MEAYPNRTLDFHGFGFGATYIALDILMQRLHSSATEPSKSITIIIGRGSHTRAADEGALRNALKLFIELQDGAVEYQEVRLGVIQIRVAMNRSYNRELARNVSFSYDHNPGQGDSRWNLEEKKDFLVQPNLLYQTAAVNTEGFSSADDAIKESLEAARELDAIGPEHIEGWTLQDVPGDGNCLFHAASHQLQQINHPVINEVPRGTETHDLLRLRAQGEEFDDGQWAGDNEIFALARQLNLIIAVVDTRNEEQTLVYYFINEEGRGELTTDLNIIDQNHRIERAIMRLAYTGAHYLSVIAAPTNGDMRQNDEAAAGPSEQKEKDQSKKKKKRKGRKKRVVAGVINMTPVVTVAPDRNPGQSEQQLENLRDSNMQTDLGTPEADVNTLSSSFVNIFTGCSLM